MTHSKFHVDDFKDSHGRWRTSSLFLETNEDESAYTSVFTLADDDKDGRLSVKKLYMELGDPTEYLPAMRIFGAVGLWEKLCKTRWFKPHVEKWRVELQARIRSEAVGTIRDACVTGGVSAQQLNAAKWLALQEWNENKPVQEKRKAPGRPPKLADPAERLKEALSAEIEEDYLRLVGDD